MPDLVRHHVVQLLLGVALGLHGDHRILHPADRSFNRRDVRPRILEPPLRVFLNAHTAHVGRFLPERLGRRTVIRKRHRPLVARGVPLILRARRPHRVAHILGGELPGLHPVLLGTRRATLEFVRGDDVHHLLRLGRFGQARDLRRGEHILGIVERSGGGHDVSSRHGHAECKVAVVQIELALSEIRLGVPAAHVVVHRHTRIPLRNLVELAVASHAVGAMLRHRKTVGDVNRRRASRCQRFGEIHLEHRFVVARRHRNATHRLTAHRREQLLHAGERVAAREVSRAEP